MTTIAIGRLVRFPTWGIHVEDILHQCHLHPTGDLSEMTADPADGLGFLVRFPIQLVIRDTV